MPALTHGYAFFLFAHGHIIRVLGESVLGESATVGDDLCMQHENSSTEHAVSSSSYNVIMYSRPQC